MAFRQPPPRPFVFLRHGETDWNRAGRLQGQREVPLNAAGRRQARAAAALLAALPLTAVLHRPLGRGAWSVSPLPPAG